MRNRDVEDYRRKQASSNQDEASNLLPIGTRDTQTTSLAYYPMQGSIYAARQAINFNATASSMPFVSYVCTSPMTSQTSMTNVTSYADSSFYGSQQIYTQPQNIMNLVSEPVTSLPIFPKDVNSRIQQSEYFDLIYANQYQNLQNSPAANMQIMGNSSYIPILSLPSMQCAEPAKETLQEILLQIQNIWVHIQDEVTSHHIISDAMLFDYTNTAIALLKDDTNKKIIASINTRLEECDLNYKSNGKSKGKKKDDLKKRKLQEKIATLETFTLLEWIALAKHYKCANALSILWEVNAVYISEILSRAGLEFVDLIHFPNMNLVEKFNREFLLKNNNEGCYLFGSLNLWYRSEPFYLADNIDTIIETIAANNQGWTKVAATLCISIKDLGSEHGYKALIDSLKVAYPEHLERIPEYINHHNVRKDSWLYGEVQNICSELLLSIHQTKLIVSETDGNTEYFGEDEVELSEDLLNVLVDNFSSQAAQVPPDNEPDYSLTANDYTLFGSTVTKRSHNDRDLQEDDENIQHDKRQRSQSVDFDFFALS